MVGPNVRQETMKLMETKDAIEAEMEGIIFRLCNSNGPGLTGNLLDEDGYPRADIDIPTVRADRHRLSVLRTDLAGVNDNIEQNLYTLHAVAAMRGSSLPQKRSADGLETRPSRIATSSQASDVASSSQEVMDDIQPLDEDGQMRMPFAVFDQVAEDSPAQRDGIMLGDLLIKFGDVIGGGQDAQVLRNRLALEGQRNLGRRIHVMVLRQGVAVTLFLTPREWAGRGLVGCHIRPL